MGREDRRKAQERFLHDPEVQVLLATDAAGEGINLQRAHLMVNYDLPWNPNRLEQRFGRIHRIGHTEVSHVLRAVFRDDAEFRAWLRMPRESLEDALPLDLLLSGEDRVVGDLAEDMLIGNPT